MATHSGQLHLEANPFWIISLFRLTNLTFFWPPPKKKGKVNPDSIGKSKRCKLHTDLNCQFFSHKKPEGASYVCLKNANSKARKAELLRLKTVKASREVRPERPIYVSKTVQASGKVRPVGSSYVWRTVKLWDILEEMHHDLIVLILTACIDQHIHCVWWRTSVDIWYIYATNFCHYFKLLGIRQGFIPLNFLQKL